jgi:hypothetical protein
VPVSTPPLTPRGTLVDERARKFDGKVMADEASVARRRDARDHPVGLLVPLGQRWCGHAARELARFVRPDVPICARSAVVPTVIRARHYVLLPRTQIGVLCALAHL